MIATVLLASFLSSQSAAAKVPAFTPRPKVRIQPIVQRPRLTREVVCDMPMVRTTPADDPKILMPPREPGAIIRRIEPDACQPR